MPKTPPEPKIELHVHLEGSVRAATLIDIARRNDIALPADTVEGLAPYYEFTDFAHFIETWLLTTRALRTAADFKQVVLDYAAEAASFGAAYIEGIFSPGEPAQRGISWDEIFTGYCEGAVEAGERFGVTVRFTPDLYRGMDPQIAEEAATTAVRYRDRGVVGFGIGGIEHGRPLEPCRKAFMIARDGGLGLVPHAGEVPLREDGTGGTGAIREALTLEPRRIRHGIYAVEDPGLLAEIVARGIVLDVCPTSNLRTRTVASLAQHPLPALRAAGAQCTINTDDPAMFDTDLGHEYEIAAELGLSTADAWAAGLAGMLDPLARLSLENSSAER